MDFTSDIRKSTLVRFMKDFAKQLNFVDENGDYAYKNSIDVFNKEFLSAGTQGKVYKATFKRPRYMYDTLVFKTQRIQNKELTPQKDIHKIYEMFFKNKFYHNPIPTEILACTLTNQLVFQNICPHFSLNYYWDIDNRFVNSFNELANQTDFDTWAKVPRSNKVWFNALFQIMVGLAALKRYFNMIHTDLHTGNVIVQSVQPGGYWVYTINNLKYYVPNLGFVFLIHDFGFSWIPQRLIPIDWHFQNTLKYITNTGKHFYDIKTFLSWVTHNKDEYHVPTFFLDFIQSAFYDEELKYVFSSQYYRIHQLPKKYQNVSVHYNGINTTLTDKIYQIFHKRNTSSHLPSFFKYNSKPHINSSFKIESYSLDKTFNKDKLPKNFKTIVT